jgi:hypothetical protein
MHEILLNTMSYRRSCHHQANDEYGQFSAGRLEWQLDLDPARPKACMFALSLSLSLSGVRAIELKDFPSRYRQSLQQAEQAFRDGQPAKASSLVCDELENLFRRLAKRCAKKKWCPDLKNKDVTKGAWATLITKVDTQLDRNQKPQCKNVTRQLLARIFGITPHRNDTGHKPHSLNKRMKMERELSTRFEGAVDLFKDFHTATKSLHL